MLSQEVADLAGVSIRTLRHYHQIGLLPEPERSANGYRRYTAADLATVLRITRLTGLGVPLAEVRRVIDDQSAANELLDRIDARAEAEIAQLTARRDRIAILRTGGAGADLPEALVPYASLLAGDGVGSERDRRFEREQLALVAHLGSDDGVAWFVAAVSRLALAGPRYLELVGTIEALTSDADTSVVDALALEMAEILVAATGPGPGPRFSRRSTELIMAHQQAHLNDAQRRVAERLIERLDVAARAALTGVGEQDRSG